jgi:predicted nucleotidyltransferase
MNGTPPAQWTQYANINALLADLLQGIQRILDRRLVGLYLYGSLVTGDFDMGASDIDLLAVTASDIDGNEFEQLDSMHLDFISRNKEWEHRLEIAYLSADALKTYRWRASNIAIMSPGEPFHVKEAGKDWLLNWYIVREKGVALTGPPPRTIIEPIAKEEFIQVLTNHVREWRDWVEHDNTRPWQAYAILTMCRALYTVRNGEHVSKRQAALWAQEELPQWSHLIRYALLWRESWRDEDVDYEATFPETVRFVHFVIDLIVPESTPESP